MLMFCRIRLSHVVIGDCGELHRAAVEPVALCLDWSGRSRIKAQSIRVRNFPLPPFFAGVLRGYLTPTN
jgi:hypothetical protein